VNNFDISLSRIPIGSNEARRLQFRSNVTRFNPRNSPQWTTMPFRCQREPMNQAFGQYLAAAPGAVCAGLEALLQRRTLRPAKRFYRRNAERRG